MSYPMSHCPAVVVAIDDLSADVRQITLAPSIAVTAWEPGAHIEVLVPVAGDTETRAYSLIGRPGPAGTLRIAVKLSPQSRGGSRFMWQLKPGDTVRISPPKSFFPLVRGAPDYLLIAGGIGITPLVGMAEILHLEGARFRLAYAAQGPGPIALAGGLTQTLGTAVEVFVAAEGRLIDLDSEIARLHPLAALYVCGPAGLLQAAQAAWLKAGRRPVDFHMETFGTDAQGGDVAFEVELMDRGSSLWVQPNETVLEALLHAGFDVAYQCRRGECGLCTVKILAHDAPLSHRDVFLSPAQKAAGGNICICVSRSAGGRMKIDSGYRDDARL